MDPLLEKLQKEVASALDGMTAEQLRWHAPGKWSAAEVLEHLYLSYTGTIKGFERVAAGGHIPSKPTWRHHAQRLVVLGLSYMPTGREAPKNTRPRGLALETIVGEIGTKIAEMDGIIARCEQTLSRGRLLEHPILGPLTATQWRKFHLVHGRHHLKQISRSRESFTGK
jgi:hypothetical protein